MFIRLACKNVSSARGFLSVKWFTKDEIFTSCFNFDLNRSASMKKMCSKMSFLSLVKKVSPLINDNEQGPSGGPEEKFDNIFIERKDDILLSCKQILNC